MPVKQTKSRDLPDKKREALVYCQKNDFLSARRALEPFLKSKSLDAEGYFLLASIYGELDQHEAAVQCFQQSIKLQPSIPQTYLGHGKSLANLGRLDEAEASFRKALQLQPQFTPAILQLAIVHCKSNRLDEAAEEFRTILMSEPASLNALMGLGRIHHFQRKNELARNCFIRALEINPRLTEAHYYLGNIYLNSAQNDEAEKHYKRAIEIDPSYTKAYLDLGNLYQSTNRFDKAIESFRRAHSIDPGNMAAIAGEASVYEQSGKIEDAYEIVNRHIARGVIDTDLGVLLSKLCRHTGRFDEAAEYLEKLLVNGQRTPVEVEKTHFALGNLYDKLRLFDKAFYHYASANANKPAPFDRTEHSGSINSLIKTFDAAFFMSAPRATQQSNRPIFIVGMPRSGTTLTEQILVSHPAIYGAGEISAFPNIIRDLPAYLESSTSFPENMRYLTAESLNSMASVYLDALNKLNSKATRVTDKTLANYLYLGLISLMFPKARVIHCMRDPRDTCLSIFFQNFDASHHYATRLENIAVFYNEYARLMNHWRGVLNIPMLEVRYEDLVNNQEEISRRLIEFADLEWSDEVLRFYENKRNVATASYDQVRQKMYTKSVARWKNYERHIGKLLEVLNL